MGLDRCVRPPGGWGAIWVAVVLLSASASGCSDEAYFHLLRPESGSIGASGGGSDGAGGASGGQPPVSMAGAGGAEDGPPLALIHRYDFEGTGTVLVDRVGDQHGAIFGGAELDGEGGLVLDGSDDYVALPSGLVSSLSGVTFAAWLEWRGTPTRCWQRIFDFGSNDAEIPGDAGRVETSIFATASDCTYHALLTALDFDSPDSGSRSQQSLYAGDALPAEVSSFVAVVLSDPDERFELYLNGELVANTEPERQLGELDDQNNWLGRSNWVQDQVVFLRARYEEFRIYGRGLSADEIRELAERGADAL